MAKEVKEFFKSLDKEIGIKKFVSIDDINKKNEEYFKEISDCYEILFECSKNFKANLGFYLYKNYFNRKHNTKMFGGEIKDIFEDIKTDFNKSFKNNIFGDMTITKEEMTNLINKCSDDSGKKDVSFKELVEYVDEHNKKNDENFDAIEKLTSDLKEILNSEINSEERAKKFVGVVIDLIYCLFFKFFDELEVGCINLPMPLNNLINNKFNLGFDELKSKSIKPCFYFLSHEQK